MVLRGRGVLSARLHTVCELWLLMPRQKGVVVPGLWKERSGCMDSEGA